MHSTVLDLHHILASKNKMTILYLTETKHSHIKSTWREALRDYKLINTSTKLEPTTNRISFGIILSIRKDIYKDATPIPTPIHLTNYIKEVTITPHDGSPIITISAYMPQIHTTAQEQMYKYIHSWIQQEITTKYQDTTILMGGDLQAIPQKDDARSNYPSLSHFCENTCLIHVNPKDVYTFIPAKTHIDHRLLWQPHTLQHYTTHNTHTTTHTRNMETIRPLS
jgi:hypothetical protein